MNPADTVDDDVRESIVGDGATLATFECETYDLELRRVTVDTDDEWPRATAHFVAFATDDGPREFAGDYSVCYEWNARHGHYSTTDHEDVRAAGGIYVDDDEPAPRMLKEGANLVEKLVDSPVHHRFR